MNNRLQQLDRDLTRREAERNLLAEQAAKLRDGLTREEESLRMWERARDLLVQVLLTTQGQVKSFVEEVVTLALSTIYGPDYGFELEYETRRNQVEATPWIVIGDERTSPRDEVGGGVLDVTSLALRLALWAMAEPRTAPTFLLDEPSKFLSDDLQADFGRMLAELADMLGAQFVVVTHSPAVAESAGAVYTVTLGPDGVSGVIGMGDRPQDVRRRRRPDPAKGED